MNRKLTCLFVVLLILFFVIAPVNAKKPVKLSERQLKKVYGACIIPDPRWFDGDLKTCKVSKGLDAGPLIDRSGELLYHSAMPVMAGVELIKATDGYIDCFTELFTGKSNLNQTGQCASKVGQEMNNNMLEAQIDTLGTGAKLGTRVAAVQFIVGSGACVARNQRANYLVGNNCIVPAEDTMQCLLDNAQGAITFKEKDIPSIVLSGVAMKANADMSAAGRAVGAGEPGYYLAGATKIARDTDTIKRGYNLISYTGSTFDIFNPVGEKVYIGDKLCTILNGDANAVSCPTNYDIMTTNPPPANSGVDILTKDENGVWNKLGYKSVEELIADQNQDTKIRIYNNNANNSDDKGRETTAKTSIAVISLPPPTITPPLPPVKTPPAPGSVDSQIADLTRIRDTLLKNSPATADTIIKIYDQQIANLKAGASETASKVAKTPAFPSYTSSGSSGGSSSHISSGGSSRGSSSGGSSSSAGRSSGSSGSSASISSSPISSGGSVGRASPSTAGEIASAARSGNISNLSPTARAVLSSR